MKLKVLKYPYPYKAWIALSNDPDHTDCKRWQELHKLIWEDLDLPFADSLFVYSFNQYLPNQINLADHKYDCLKHTYDTIHTWGDFQHAGDKSFVRSDAEKAKILLQKYHVAPKVWIDHSSFEGNFMHNSTNGTKPFFKDASGYTYDNQKYSLDIAYDIGIRYLWDGKLTSEITDVFIRKKRLINRAKRLKLIGKVISKLFSEFMFYIDENYDLNRSLYKIKQFPGGYKFYIFRRYGLWKKADIEGLADLLCDRFFKRIIKKTGAAIIYTHLGKTKVNSEEVVYKVSDKTKDALKKLKDNYLEKKINLSSVSEMLDYAVIRDNIKVTNERIIFYSDGIRFENLKLSDLAGKRFSFIIKNGQSHSPIVVLEGEKLVDYKLVDEGMSTFSIVFS